MDSGSAAGETDANNGNGEEDKGGAASSKLLCRRLPSMYREELWQTMKLTGPMVRAIKGCWGDCSGVTYLLS